MNWKVNVFQSVHCSKKEVSKARFPAYESGPFWEPTELSSAAPGVGFPGGHSHSLNASVSWHPLLVTEGSANGCVAAPGTGSKGDSRTPDALAAGPSLQQDP